MVNSIPLEPLGTLAPGGTDPHTFDWREAWYPVFYLDDLQPQALHRFTLLGQDLVIWWDGDHWRAMVDRCPHRLVPLSEGRLTADRLLECPYHGWAFDGQGHCRHIPQAPQDNQSHQSSRACITTFATQVAQGLLFVYAGDATRSKQVPLPLIPALEENPQSWICLNTFRDLPYDATTLLENVLDASHIPFTHHKTVGDRKNAAPVELELVQADRQGFTGFWAEGPRRGTLGRQDTSFVAPALMWHDLTAKQLGRTLTVVYATPMRKGECRLFARFPFQFSSWIPRLFISLTPRWYSHIGNHRVLEDDQIFLHYQERSLEAERQAKGAQWTYAQSCYLPTRADRFVLSYHQWLKDWGEAFPGVPLPPLQSRDQLLDRYHSHTQHCQACRTALKNLRRLHWGLGSLGGVALALAPWLAGGSTALGIRVAYTLGTIVLGLGLWKVIGLKRDLCQGSYPPPRNQLK